MRPLDPSIILVGCQIGRHAATARAPNAETQWCLIMGGWSEPGFLKWKFL